jgi:hypothetical protein
MRSPTIEKPGPDFVCITKFLEEATVFGNSLDTECLVLTSNGVYQVVEGDRDGASITSDISRVYIR